MAKKQKFEVSRLKKFVPVRVVSYHTIGMRNLGKTSLINTQSTSNYIQSVTPKGKTPNLRTNNKKKKS